MKKIVLLLAVLLFGVRVDDGTAGRVSGESCEAG